MNNWNDLKKKRWLFLFLFCAINFCTGALYIWSVFAGPLAVRLNELNGSSFTASDLGQVFGLAAGVTPFLMLAGGFINDRLGPKLVVIVGGAMVGLGYIICGLSSSLTMLYIGYGLCVGIGTGMVNGCTINSAVKFFPDKKGFAGGLVTASLGIGAALLPFAINGLIEVFGISSTCLYFGIFSGVFIPLCAAFTDKCPDHFADSFVSLSSGSKHIGIETNWVGMLKSPLFIPLFALFITGSTMGLMLISSLAGIAQNQIGLGLGAAATAVSVISVANTIGRFVSGTVSDKFGRVQTLIVMLVLALAGFVLLTQANASKVSFFFIGIVLIGLCYGAFIGTYPSLVADEFGSKHNSVNLSLMFLGYSVGGFAGPALIKWAQESGSNDLAYWICMSAGVIGIAFACFYLYLKKKDQLTLNNFGENHELCVRQ